jgi:probable HAF family extracellular repeat protein
MRALPAAPDGSVGTAYGINDAGQVVGAFVDSNHSSALLWTAGQAIRLVNPGDGKSWATAINNVGQVVGVVWQSYLGNADTRGFLWTPDVPNGTAGTMIDLGTVGSVTSINDLGQVVGWREGEPFLWTPSSSNGTSGTMTGLPLLDAYDINNEGQVAGDILVDGSDSSITHAALWTPGTPNGATGIVTDLYPGNFENSTAWALSPQRNGSTKLVGYAFWIFTNWMYPVLWTVSQEQAPPFSLTVAPAAVTGGSAATGTVVLAAAAPDGGAIVALDSDNAAATVPASVTVDAGATTATFEISTTPVAYSRRVSISAVYNGGIRHAQLGVTQPLRVDYLDLPPSIVGGWIANGTVYLNAPPLLDSAVQLSSSAPELATVPASVTVLGFNTEASFEVFTGPVSVPTPVTITAAFAGTTLSFTLILNPVRSLESLTVSPASVPAGTVAFGTVTLGEVALAPVGISLYSRDEWVATVPSDVTVPVGARTASFPISTNRTTYSIDVELDAYLHDPRGNTRRIATLNVTRPVTLLAIGLNPDAVRGGTSSTGWVTLDGPAPAGGVAVALASSDTAIATVPASVSVPQGVAVIDFAVSTTAGASGAVTISGSFGGTARSAVLGVSSGPTLASLSVSPASVRGGRSSTGTVVLTETAPAGGAAIALSSSSPVARVPALLTVPAGATGARFTVSTSRPSSSTNATISAAFDGTTKSADLTITR